MVDTRILQPLSKPLLRGGEEKGKLTCRRGPTCILSYERRRSPLRELLREGARGLTCIHSSSKVEQLLPVPDRWSHYLVVTMLSNIGDVAVCGIVRGLDGVGWG